MPVTPGQASAYQEEIASVCDEFLCWQQTLDSTFTKTAKRAAYLFKREPVSVVCDYNEKAAALIKNTLQSAFDLVVFDYSHSAILAPA